MSQKRQEPEKRPSEKRPAAKKPPSPPKGKIPRPSFEQFSRNSSGGPQRPYHDSTQRPSSGGYQRTSAGNTPQRSSSVGPKSSTDGHRRHSADEPQKPKHENRPGPKQTAPPKYAPRGKRSEMPSNVQVITNPNQSRSRKISTLDRAEHIRATQRKRTIASALFLSVIVILIMVVTAAAILYVTDYVAAKPNYSFVTNGTIEHSIGATALIIRDEQTFSSAAQGSLVALALEGSRVCKNQELAMVIPDGLDSTSASLRNIQQQIVSRQRELMALGKGSGADTICLEADNEILPIVNMIRTDSLSDSLSNLMSYSSSVQVLMDKRDSDLQSIDFQDEQLSALIVSKSDLESTLAAQADTLRAVVPGIVSYKLDGFENTLNSAFVAAITPEQYADYVQKSKGILSNDLNIKKDEAALRICQNAEQYLVTLVAGCSVTDFPMDAVCNIRVPSEGIVITGCKVIRSVQSIGGVFVAFQTTNQVERLLDRRTAEIEIIQSSTPGLRVPASSLIDADYKTGFADILYNNSGSAGKLKVVVVDHDREYAIIAPVEGFDVPNLSTIIITNPNTISEGDKVEQ
ncbi:MAG: HlyD family efflux transporter periplasmic adaptor subunit [Eubacteriales bacterium]